MKRLIFTLLGLGLSIQAANADSFASDQKFISLDNKVQSLKTEVISVGEEINALEEELLFPPSSQLVVFFSADIDSTVKVVSSQLQIDGKNVANHMYDIGEQEALQNGGVQQLYMGNIKPGDHKLSIAYMVKLGKRTARYSSEAPFKKDKNPVYLKLNMQGKEFTDNSKQDPRFSIKEWK